MTLRLLRIALLALAGLAVAAVASTVSLAQQQMQDVTPHHVARDGDTLWSLSHQYFNDPYFWPQLWSWNPHVTNPHWIYPGDLIFLGPRELVPAGERSAARSRLDLDGDAGMYFPLGGFYTSSELDHVGTLRFARTDRRMLHPMDEVYLQFEDPDRIQIGDELVINRVEGRIEGERRGEVVAVKYRTTGRVRITRRYEETELLGAEIVQLYDVIERDDLLFASHPQLLLVEPRENTVNLTAEIIDGLDSLAHMHQYHYVFIDVGTNDGVRVGNRFFIWMREDGGESIRLARSNQEYRDEVQSLLPWQLVGEAMAIYVGETYSTAVITSANHEVTAGQRVTLQSGF